MRNYKNLNVWVRSHNLVTQIYKDFLPVLPESEKYGLSNQIRRATYSIPLNIAEGCGRTSDKEFARFLEISLGSAQELEYCLLLCKDLFYINEDSFLFFDEKVNEVKAMIINLIKKIRT